MHSLTQPQEALLPLRSYSPAVDCSPVGDFAASSIQRLHVASELGPPCVLVPATPLQLFLDGDNLSGGFLTPRPEWPHRGYL